MLGHRDQFKYFYHDSGTPAITALCYGTLIHHVMYSFLYLASNEVLLVGDEFGSLYRVHLASKAINLVASHTDGIFSITHSTTHNTIIAVTGFNRIAIHTPSRSTMRIMQRNIKCVHISPSIHGTSSELVWVAYADSCIEAYDIHTFSDGSIIDPIPINSISHAHNRKKRDKGQQGGTCSQLAFDPLMPHYMYSVGLPDK